MALQGVKLVNNFQATRIEFNQLMDYMSSTLKMPLTLNLNIGQIQQQLSQVVNQTEQLKTTMSGNMGNINSTGLDKMVTTTKLLSGEMANMESKVVKVSSSMGQTVQTTERFNKVLQDGVFVEEKMGATVIKTTDLYKQQALAKQKAITTGENALVERENAMIQETISLLNQEATYTKNISLAQKDANLTSIQALTIQKEINSAKLLSAQNGLGNASASGKITVLNEENALIQKQDLLDANIIGKIELQNAEFLKQTTILKEKSILQGESALVQRENILLGESTALMTQQLNLEQQIKVAKQSGNVPLEQMLVLREKDVALQLQSANANLSNSSTASKSIYLQTELETKNGIALTNAKLEGQEQLLSAEIKRRILLYQQEKELQLSGMTQKYGSSINTASLQQSTLAYKQLGTAGITSLSQLSAKEQEINIGIKEMGANAKVTANALKQVGTSGGVFSSMLKNIGAMATWTIAATAIFGTINAIKTGISSAIDLDKTFSNLSVTMAITRSDFKEMTSEMQKMAIATGSSVESVMNASKIYANMGESASSILAKTKSAIMLSNVSGLDTTATTDSLHSIINQFDLAGQDATSTSEHIASSLVAISKNMAMDFGAGIEEISAGIQKVGTVASETGKMTSDATESMLGAIIEKTRMGFFSPIY